MQPDTCSCLIAREPAFVCFQTVNLKPQEGTLIFPYIRRLVSLFGVQNFEFQYFWGFQKNEYFFFFFGGGGENFMDIFWGSL